MRDSFVIHTEYIEDLPEESKGEFLMHIYNYAAKGMEPSLDGFAKTVWLKIKRRIDQDCATYDKKSRNLKQNKKMSDTESELSETENSLSDTENELSETEEGLSDTENALSETEKPLSDGVYVSEFVSVSDSESEFESVSESESEGGGLTSPPQDYSKTIFEIFKGAGLPCCGNNYISFVQKDFKLALPFLRGLHSDEVIAASQNYASIFQRSDIDPFWKKQKVPFDRFAEKKIRDFLPENFVLERYLGGKEESKWRQAL